MLDFISKLFRKEQYEPEETTQRPDFEKLLVGVPDCINPDFRICLDVMTVADTHGNLMQKDVMKALSGNPNPDVVFFLGDNYPDDIEAVLEVVPKHIRMYGVAGNHDFKDILTPYSERIIDVSKNCYSTGGMVGVTGYSVGGLSGSIRYKDDECYAMLTNEESNAIMEDKPQVDILITHDKPCFTLPEKITSHSGLTGIGNYILRAKPKIVLHGHLHEKYIKRMGDTIIRSCYGVETFKVSF